MRHIAYLHTMLDQWFEDFVYITVEPLKKRGFEIVKFDDLDRPLSGFNVTKNDIVIGSVEACVEGFQQMGVEVPKYLGFPKELEFALYRDITIKTKEELYNLPLPFFIKPKDGVKDFTGEVILCKEDIDRIMGHLPSDYQVYYCSEVMEDIQSEYRCFIHRGEIKGIQNYLGDVAVFPDPDFIKDLVSKYKNAPVAYTLDIAVRNNNFNVLMEVNDFWAIGSYGLDGTTYTRCYVDRWFEIIKNNEIN